MAGGRTGYRGQDPVLTQGAQGLGEEKFQSQPSSPIQSRRIWVEQDTQDDLGLGGEWELTICLPQHSQNTCDLLCRPLLGIESLNN